MSKARISKDRLSICVRLVHSRPGPLSQLDVGVYVWGPSWALIYEDFVPVET